MALQTMASTLSSRLKLMVAAFADLFLNVGRDSLPTFPLMLAMARPYLFGSMSGSGRAF